jgi:hypothetical protein
MFVTKNTIKRIKKEAVSEFIDKQLMVMSFAQNNTVFDEVIKEIKKDKKIKIGKDFKPFANEKISIIKSYLEMLKIHYSL